LAAARDQYRGKGAVLLNTDLTTPFIQAYELHRART